MSPPRDAGQDNIGSSEAALASSRGVESQLRYCTDAGGGVPSSTCKSGSDIVIGTHTVRSPELCKDVDLTDCKAAAELTTAQMQADYVFSGVRWCNSSGMTFRMSVRPSVADPPAASTTNASGFASYNSRSLPLGLCELAG